jgi:uncharacterized protein (DUF1697 family)
VPVYIALLRGINVGGHKKVAMARLRESCAALGFEQVQTYVQSGNVIFRSGKLATTELCQRLEKKILADFGFPVPVILRTGDEFRRAREGNPFLKKPGIDTSKLHVTFLSAAPAPAAVKKLDGLTAAPEDFRCCGREIYLCCPNGLAESKLFRADLERLLAVRVTTRNWNTVNKLCEISSACG